MVMTTPAAPIGKKVRSGLSSLGLGVLGLVIFGAVLWGVVWLFSAYLWLFQKFYPVIKAINTWTFYILLLLLASAVFKKMRGMAGLGLYIGSTILGVTFWLFCLYVTYEHWGLTGVVVGIVLAGVGVFATACLSLLFAKEFSDFFSVVFTLAMIYGFRAIGTWLIHKYDEQWQREQAEKGLLTRGGPFEIG